MKNLVIIFAVFVSTIGAAAQKFLENPFLRTCPICKIKTDTASVSLEEIQNYVAQYQNGTMDFDDFEFELLQNFSKKREFWFRDRFGRLEFLFLNFNGNISEIVVVNGNVFRNSFEKNGFQKLSIGYSERIQLDLKSYIKKKEFF
ncbi:hypothetical protein HN954_03150 [bacterium]|mgnify:CR=1 FL=1|jgi:hypothetical protein|nr:hypothetical protein [bacterium]MBT6832152.1 hypothetical protein [bacterium]MBT6996402.1 hypothetical protein [bacterium]MBT7772137.1 hypothetical protein [bacterium]